ncbi:MAG: FtsX-like permease family protein [Acidobacteriota bacterium]
MNLLLRASRRSFSGQPAQSALAVFGIALGVAVAVAVQLANSAALRAFDLSSGAVMGRATHRLVGGPSGIDESFYVNLVGAGNGGALAGAIAAAPVVEGTVTFAAPRADRSPAGGTGSRTDLRILGIDPFAEAPFRPWLTPQGSGRAGGTIDLRRLLTRPGAVLMSRDTAEAQGITGDGGNGELSVLAGGTLEVLTVAGLLDAGDPVARAGLRDLLVTDIATAQELLGLEGRLSRIDFALDAEEAATLARTLPLGTSLVTAEAGRRSARAMTRAFRVNLQALGLLALLCGMFLIYGTMTFSVVRRRTHLGILRALGVSRRQILGLVMGEAAAIGMIGSGLGVALGTLLGRGLVGRVTRTLDDLYFAASVGVLETPWALLAAGFGAGLTATLLAAIAPALEAAWAPPRAVLSRSHLEERARALVPRANAAAAFGILAGGAVLAAGRSLELSFVGLFAVVMAAALLTPAATILLTWLIRPLAGRLFGAAGRMAVQGVVTSISRTAVATAALMIAVAMTLGVGTMISSFRGTLADWLDNTLLADFYLSPPGRGDTGGFDPGLAERAAALPGVAYVATIRRVEIATETGTDRLLVVNTQAGAPRGFELLTDSPDGAWRAFDAGAVMLTEPYARHRNLWAGDSVTLRTDQGPRTFNIAGVVYSYASDQGEVLFARPVYERWFHDRRISALSVTAADGVDLGNLGERLENIFGNGLAVRSNHRLRDASMVVFDRTFKVTNVLRTLAGLVAFLGVLSSLMALQLERTRELGVLRATGMTPGQLWRMLTGQTAITGLAAGLFALPIGTGLAALMIFVINRRSFGWSLRMTVAPLDLLAAVALATGAALLAGLYPAWKMARTSPAEALREE